MINVSYLLLSFLITMVLSIPFIGFLYKVNLRTSNVRTEDQYGARPIFNRLHAGKSGTPTGGGILIILVIAVLFSLVTLKKGLFFNYQTMAILFTLGSFWIVGLYDDTRKLLQTKSFGLRIRHKFLIQFLFSLTIGYYLYLNGHDGILIPVFGKLYLGKFYAFFSAFVITFLASCFNITDGLDGLSGGIYLIISLVLLSLSQNPVITNYLLISFGVILAYMYFNVKPARYFYGDSGALPIGATLGLFLLISQSGLLLTLLYALVIVEGLSSLIQLTSKRLTGKKVFLMAPFHHYLEAKGWEEYKVVTRFWLAQIVISVVFLFIYGLLAK